MVARAIHGVMAGTGTAFVVVLAIETIGIRIFPQPAAMATRMLPAAIMLIVLASWLGLRSPVLARP